MTQLSPDMRIWLHNYRDLHSIPTLQFSLDLGNWDQMLECISDDLIFTSKPKHTAIPMQGHLVQVRHHAVSTKLDLQNCLSDERIWLRSRDPNSTKRKLSSSSIRILQLYHQFQNLSPVRSMWPKPIWQGLCVADAYAAGSNAGIGGAVFLPSGACTWFSLQLQHSDFKSFSIPNHEDFLVVLVVQLVSQHSCVADRLPVVVRFPAGPRVRLKTVNSPKGNGLGQKQFQTTKIYKKTWPHLRHWLKLLLCFSRFSSFPALAFPLRSQRFLIILAPRPSQVNYLPPIYP